MAQPAYNTEEAQRQLWSWLTANGANDPSATSPTVTEGLSSTGTVTAVPANVASTTLKAANTSRKGLVVYNDNGSLYLSLASSSSFASFSVVLAAGAYFELPLPVYTGIVTGIWTGQTNVYADGVSNTDTSYTSATAAFVATDKGRTITGTNIPAATTIATVTNATTLVLSQATTGTGTSLAFTLGRGARITELT